MNHLNQVRIKGLYRGQVVTILDRYPQGLIRVRFRDGKNEIIEDGEIEILGETKNMANREGIEKMES